MTSNVVFVVLMTLMYFSGIGKDSSVGTYSLTRNDSKWNLLKQIKNHFWTSSSYHDQSWRGVEEAPSDSLRRLSCSSPLSGLVLINDNLRSWSPQNFWLFYLRLTIKKFRLSVTLTLPLYWAFGSGVQIRPSLPILQCLRLLCLLFRSPSRTTHIQGIYLTRL